MQLSTNNIKVRWLLTVIFFVVMLFAGVFNAVYKINKGVKQIEGIDFAIYDLYKEMAEAEKVDGLINRLYGRT